MVRAVRVAYIGNHVPPHSTENHVTQALRAIGHRVVQFQENDRRTWMPGIVVREAPDVIMWTKTWTLSEFAQRERLDEWRTLGVPTVMYHLDRWWGLGREHQVFDEPIFRCDLVCTADGGHDDDWKRAGVDHVWFPPAVSQAETQRKGRTLPRMFPEPIVFVGSTGHYHGEWEYRLQLIAWLRATYGRQFGCWPRDARSVRGQPLADLYATARVVVGDSCLCPLADGTPIERYWSDRIPETLGRGGFLIHPSVGGLWESYPPAGLVTYTLGDFATLKALIDHFLDRDNDPARQLIARTGKEHVMAHETYEVRMQRLTALLIERNMVAA